MVLAASVVLFCCCCWCFLMTSRLARVIASCSIVYSTPGMRAGLPLASILGVLLRRSAGGLLTLARCCCWVCCLEGEARCSLGGGLISSGFCE